VQHAIADKLVYAKIRAAFGGRLRGSVSGASALAPEIGYFFMGAGVLHFVRPKMYEAIVPPGLGDPRTLVLLSGAAEVVGGVAIGVGRPRPFARWWLLGADSQGVSSRHTA